MSTPPETDLSGEATDVDTAANADRDATAEADVDDGGVTVFPMPARDLPTPATCAAPQSPQAGGGDTADAADGGRKPFLYRSLPDWYAAWLAKTIERRFDATGTGTLTWCPRWWAHPEVIARLEALWRAWEVARHQDGDAPARWFAQLDQNLKTLMDAKLGPMADCGPDTHRRYANTRPLPNEPTPPGFWGSTEPDSGPVDRPGRANL